MPTDDEIKLQLKTMGLGRSVLPVHVRMLLTKFCPKEAAATTRAPSGVLFENIAISELPEAGEYERGYNKAIALMRARLETGYGTEHLGGSETLASAARRSRKQSIPK